MNAFDFQAPAPAHNLLPSVEPEEILGVTVIIITASYRDKEFVRVGYYVNTYYEEEEWKENPPDQVVWDKLFRNVLIEKPKVTRWVDVCVTDTDGRFQNPWDTGASNPFDVPLTESEPQATAEMLFNAPLPPPVQKAPPGPPVGHEHAMDMDQPMSVT